MKVLNEVIPPPQEFATLRSSISPSLLKRSLWKGTLFALTGVSILLFGGIELPPEKLQSVGIFLFIMALGLIIWGLLPYRLLKYLELHPHRLTCDNQTCIFHFSSRSRRKSEDHRIVIPLENIQEIIWIENSRCYGIGLFLKEVSSDQMKTLQRRCRRRFGCDIFLPYFTKRSYNRLLSKKL